MLQEYTAAEGDRVVFNCRACERYVFLSCPSFASCMPSGSASSSGEAGAARVGEHTCDASVPNDLIPPVLEHGPRSLPNVRVLW